MTVINNKLEPPNNKDAEKGVIGSLIRDNKLVADVARMLQVEDFYSFAHQKVFEALTDLCIHQGKPADPVTLADYLHEKNLIADVGGYEYLVELWHSAPALGYVDHYARIVRQKSIVRHLIHACGEVQKEALDQNVPAEELLESAEKRIFDIAQQGIRITPRHFARPSTKSTLGSTPASSEVISSTAASRPVTSIWTI